MSRCRAKRACGATTDVIGLFDAETDMNDVVAILENHPLLGAGFAHKIEQLEDKDWEREWMDNFHRCALVNDCGSRPSWRDVPDENAVNVMLDPGLAFGTGTHPTTSLCLQWLDSLDLTGKTVIDFGCGSGILAIAALKLGAAKAIGIDIDPQAIQASRDNAERNGVSDRLELYLPKDQPEEMKADVVVANILAGPLRELAPLISVLPVSGGLLGLSGILASTMSTADSQLLAASSSVSQNLLQEAFHLKLSQKASMIAARTTVIVIAVLGLFLAKNPDSSVFGIVSFAWAGFGAAFGPVVMCALFWKRATFPGAVAGMISGGVMVFVWKYLIRPIGGVWGIYELLPAFLVGTMMIVVVSLLTKKPSAEIEAEFELAKKKTDL